MSCMSIPVQRSCWFGSSGHLLCHHGCLRWDCWLAKCGSLRPSSFDFKASRDDLVAFFNTVVHEGKMSVYIEWPYLHSLLFRSKRHGYALRRKTSPNLSKSIFPPNYWHRLKSSTKTKMGNFPKEFWRQQHPVFPGGHPSKYWLGSMLLNFSDRTRTGVFNMIWPLARGARKSQDSFSTKHIPTYICIRDSAHRLGWNVVGLNLDYFYNYPLVSWAFPAVLNPVFWALLCTKYFK